MIDTIQSSGSIVDGVTYDPVNDQVYAVNAGSGTVSVIDGATRAVVDTITVGAYESSRGESEVSLFPWAILIYGTRYLVHLMRLPIDGLSF